MIGKVVRRDFNWLGNGERLETVLAVLHNRLIPVTGVLDHEHKTHCPERDRLSRDSQHRVWDGYDWEIL